MIVAIIGRRGMGKTTMAAYVVRLHHRRGILDPRSCFPPGPDGVIVTELSANTLTDWWEDTETVIFRPSGDLQASADQMAAQVREYLVQDPTAQLAALLDEVGTLEPRTGLRAWNWLFRTADRHRVWFVMTAHRPTDFPPDVLALVDWLIVFRTTQSNDLERLADRCGERFAELARRLPERVALKWDDSETDESKQVTELADPDVWKMPLDRPSVVGPAEPEIMLLGTPVKTGSLF